MLRWKAVYESCFNAIHPFFSEGYRPVGKIRLTLSGCQCLPEAFRGQGDEMSFDWSFSQLSRIPAFLAALRERAILPLESWSKAGDRGARIV